MPLPEQKPAVILVNTQMPENIGAAARAMRNFGLEELILVAPRDGFPHEKAYDLAGHAGCILDKAKVFSTTREAIAGFEYIYAATARPREMVKPVVSPLAACETMQVRCGILFGPERSGLVNEDITLADSIITIPTAEQASLNIAQSVVVIAYQWFQLQSKAVTPLSTKRSELATKQELGIFLDFLEKQLDAKDFWRVEEKKPKMWQNLQNIFTRNSLTQQEVRTLHGLIAELGRERK